MKTVVLNRESRIVEATIKEINRAEFNPAFNSGKPMYFQYNPAFSCWFDHLGYRWTQEGGYSSGN